MRFLILVLLFVLVAGLVLSKPKVQLVEPGNSEYFTSGPARSSLADGIWVTNWIVVPDAQNQMLASDLLGKDGAWYLAYPAHLLSVRGITPAWWTANVDVPVSRVTAVELLTNDVGEVFNAITISAGPWSRWELEHVKTPQDRPVLGGSFISTP